MIDYNKRLVEVSVILNHLNKSDYNKIPKEIIETIEKNKDIEYVWNYDETKELKNQNVSKDTIAILSYINMQYLLNEEQKIAVQEIFNENQKKIENIKKEKYNADNLFKNIRNEKNEVEKETQALVAYKERNFIEKLFDKIKSILKIK